MSYLLSFCSEVALGTETDENSSDIDSNKPSLSSSAKSRIRDSGNSLSETEYFDASEGI